jgi:hypothetical protein
MTRKQLDALIQQNPLTLAVAQQLGYSAVRSNTQDRTEFGQTLADIREHGASVGWSGFIYYSETSKFAEKHYRTIMRKVHEFERETGEPFGEDTYRDADEDCAHNWMAWFALESVANDAETVTEDDAQ